MKKNILRIVLAGGLVIASQGFGMKTGENNQQRPGGGEVTPVDELAMMRQRLAETERRCAQLEAAKAQKDAEFERLRGDTRVRLRESALGYYNAHLGKTGLPDSVELAPVTKLPNVGKIEDRLSDFFANINTKLPKLAGNVKIEDREKNLCEVISIVNDLHTYMEQSLLPLRHACNEVYRDDTMPVIEEKTEVGGPSGEVVEKCRTLPEVITACQEQLTVIDALLQATELALQTEYKKNIFPDSDGCHVVYVEAWDERSRQDIRLQEIRKRRESHE